MPLPSTSVLYGTQSNRVGRRGLGETCYDAIKKKIITCELTPGDVISEKMLTSELGVSRTPIREALFRLQQERLVEVLPKRGIFVSTLSVQDVIDLFLVREIIEPFATMLATPHMPIEVLAEWKTIYNRIIAAEPMDVEKHIDLDRQFHLLVARQCRNSYLENIMISIYDQNSRIRFLSLREDPAREIEAIKEHLVLIEEFLAHSPQQAREAMKRHIIRAREAALKVIQEPRT